MRLDVFLFENKYTNSRTRARNLIELNQVLVNNKIISKPAFEVTENDKIDIIEDYDASLGSIKLTKALTEFNISIKNKICLDVGASNGGFTDVLIKNGASKVYALDIAFCALPERLKNDDRIIIKDKTNARNISKNDFVDNIELCTIDVSFISLKLILPAIRNTISRGEIIALIKPQFEVSKKDLNKSGIVKNKKLIPKVIEDIKSQAISLEFNVIGYTTAPHPFPNKNQEYLLYLTL